MGLECLPIFPLAFFFFFDGGIFCFFGSHVLLGLEPVPVKNVTGLSVPYEASSALAPSREEEERE